MAYSPDTGMLLTCYAPLRRSPPSIATRAAPRLACVKPAASVHPEPGSNSSLYNFYYFFKLALLLLVCYFSLIKKLTLYSQNLFVLKNNFGTCLYFCLPILSMNFSRLRETLHSSLPLFTTSLPKRECKGKDFFQSCKNFNLNFLKIIFLKMSLSKSLRYYLINSM